MGTLARPLAALTIALAAGSGLVASPAAHAATGPTLTRAGGLVTVTPGTNPLDLYISTSTGTPGNLTFSETGWTTAPTGCFFLYGGTSYLDCSGVTKIVVNGTSGADYVSLGDGVVVPSEIHGGLGDDNLYGGDGNDKMYGDGGKDYLLAGPGVDRVEGGAGDDYQVRGDEGNDTVLGDDGNDRVMGGPGRDTVSGGVGNDFVYGDCGCVYYEDDDGNDILNGDTGNDTLYPAGGKDVVNGGAGVDTATYEGFRGDGVTVRLSLDNLANDGPAGEADNIGPLGDVENLTAPDYYLMGPIVVTGNDGPNLIDGGYSRSSAVIDGRGGDDEIVSTSGQDDAVTVRGGDGDDVIHGSSTDEAIFGGAGTDDIDGSSGNDTIDPGPGPDQVFGGSGNDVVKAVDNELDTISCGRDADIARVDTGDVVAVDLDNLCESLTKVAPAKPNVVVPTTAEYRLDASGKASFSLTNNSAFPVTVTAAAATTKPVGSGSMTLPAKAAGSLLLQLNADGLATVNARGSMRASVTFTLTGNKQTTTVKRVVTFLEN
jgi:Ca2+-binding RTX toxin-like protein